MTEGSRAREVRTGFFVLVGAVLFVALSLWVAGVDPWGPSSTRHRVLMTDAGGVRAGDAVRVAGVRVGRVTAVTLRADPEWPVVFDVELDAGAPVGRQSRALFGSDGLLGSAFLSLEPASPGEPLVADGDELRAGGGVSGVAGVADSVARMGAAMARAVELFDQTSALLDRLDARVDPLLDRVEAVVSEENAAELQRSLALLRGALEETGPRLPGLLDRLESTLANLDEGAQGVPRVTGEARALLGDLRAAVGPDGQRLSTLLDSANGAIGSATDTLGVVTGSAADLEAAMRDLRSAADNLEALTRSLGERPQRLLIPSRQPDRRPGEGVPP